MDIRHFQVSVVVWLMLLGAVTAGPAMAGNGSDPVVITFECFPGPDGQLGTADDVPISAPDYFSEQPHQVTTEFAPLGLTFRPDPPLENMNEIVNDSTFERQTGSRDNVLSTYRSDYSYGPIVGEFTIPGVRRLSMAIGLCGCTSAADELTVYDAFGNILDSVTGKDEVVTLETEVDIRRFRVASASSSWQAAIDDVEFVPEPGTVALIAVGLAAVGWRRRRPFR